MKTLAIYFLLGGFILITSFYISAIEGAIVWGLWNFMTKLAALLPTISYRNSVGVLLFPNTIFVSYRLIKLWKTL